jgi:hypothetical protein
VSLTALALAITWGVTPGAWLARRLASSQPSDARAAFALVASPFACGAVLVLVRACGMRATLAAQAISGVLALLAAGEALRPKAGHGPGADTRSVWGMALGFGALVLAAHAFEPALSWRSDGSFHAGLVWAVERGIPPEDPFFAGLPLRYAWGPHAWAAGWLSLAPDPRASPLGALGALTPLVWANAGAAIAALLAVGALARRLGAGPGACALAQGLALVGSAPFGWLALAARAMRGDVRGAAELAQSLEHGADTAFRALDPGWLHPSLVLPLDKFVVLTPFAWALAAAVVAYLTVAAWADTRARRSLAAFAIAIAAAIFAHPFTGLALVIACGAGATPLLVRPAARPLAGGLFLALVAAVLVTLPYLVSLAGPSGGRDLPAGIGVGVTGVLSVLVAGAIVLPMAARVLLTGPRLDGFPVFALGVLLALVVPACVLSLAGENQSKFLNVAFLLASAPAAVGWSRLGAPWRRIAAVAGVLAVGPTLVASLWAYTHESWASQDAPSRPPREILAAVKRFVPRNAVLVDATQDTTRGAAPALPGETGRSLLWSGGFLARKWGHPRADLVQRSISASGVASGAWPVRGIADGVGEYARELWLLTPETSARAPDPRERVVARADGVLLVRLQP